MHVLVNGEPHEPEKGATLLSLLTELGEPVEAAVIELNGRYVSSRDLAGRPLSDGDRIEVILPAFGG